jgi:hypothetical protein
MYQASDLLQRYHSLISAPIVSNRCVSGECVSKLLETPWVKIMVVRYQMAPEVSMIEIEVSLPHCIIEPTYPTTAAEQEEAHSFIDSNLEHLKYLLRLQEAGFALGILSTEGIWSAILKIKGEPSLDLFNSLLPPI